MHRRLSALILGLLLWGAPGPASDGARADGAGVQLCKPRSTTAPGRLTIDSRADGFGLVSSCEATLVFYVARNTALRAVSGHLRVTDPSGLLLDDTMIRVELAPTAAGMLSAERPVPGIPRHRCRDLSISVTGLLCHGADGARIDCPDIRITQPTALGSLEIGGGGLNICRTP